VQLGRRSLRLPRRRFAGQDGRSAAGASLVRGIEFPSPQGRFRAIASTGAGGVPAFVEQYVGLGQCPDRLWIRVGALRKIGLGAPEYRLGFFKATKLDQSACVVGEVFADQIVTRRERKLRRVCQFGSEFGGFFGFPAFAKHIDEMV
jgi:hypothetical protein